MALNVSLDEPEPPGPWIVIYETGSGGAVKGAECICGEHLSEFNKFNSHVSFGEAADELRTRNQAAEEAGDLLGQTVHDPADPPGGFRGRGSVLWMMHVIKLERWYEKHGQCFSFDWGEYCSTHDDDDCRRIFAELEAYLEKGGVPRDESEEAAERILYDGVPADDILAEYEFIPF